MCRFKMSSHYLMIIPLCLSRCCRAPEPQPLWDPSQPLYSDPRVLSLPHCGFSTEEVYDGLVSLVVRNIAASREGGDLVNRVC
mmetsp:Transcript_10288/g.26395  ORF Transcript_10288/g.26395 Transcript_10288/m.26395 type:complete len:83 (-) Transcript_10288:191-439(-)